MAGKIHRTPSGRRSRGTGRPRGRPRGVRNKDSWELRVLAWASTQTGTFETADVARAFSLSREHASMLLTRLVRAVEVQRVRRGLYRFLRARA